MVTVDLEVEEGAEEEDDCVGVGVVLAKESAPALVPIASQAPSEAPTALYKRPEAPDNLASVVSQLTASEAVSPKLHSQMVKKNARHMKRPASAITMKGPSAVGVLKRPAAAAADHSVSALSVQELNDLIDKCQQHLGAPTEEKRVCSVVKTFQRGLWIFQIKDTKLGRAVLQATDSHVQFGVREKADGAARVIQALYAAGYSRESLQALKGSGLLFGCHCTVGQ